MPLWILGSKQLQNKIYEYFKDKVYDLAIYDKVADCIALYEEDNWDDRYLERAFNPSNSSLQEIAKFIDSEKAAAVIFSGWSIFDPLEFKVGIIKSKDTKKSAQMILKELAWNIHRYTWDFPSIFVLTALLDKYFQDIGKDILTETEYPSVIIIRMDGLLNELVK
ncbi:MAG: hypothetical protein DSO07_08720 [Thermoproteota archaeon]|jgi:hypothetical protein|uniref:Uncharacterized protein n=1 Tax=Candidatus Methanodesulfokora washburnensis TaxID=2478471 RepID=A0A3R9R545_9CREN|nr:hypothetical protein [Candidatus Methanodesulfokores washburnensis]RSN74976.1 hypothetical protein D6D85_07090 [Candidatus Methanodesulfokores washburnensis]TDA40636.1 MAG: hypothetical protein DSO07_08720 [Candidatus Korarchaeota archaeon]